MHMRVRLTPTGIYSIAGMTLVVWHESCRYDSLELSLELSLGLQQRGKRDGHGAEGGGVKAGALAWKRSTRMIHRREQRDKGDWI